MTRKERWIARYNEVFKFIEPNQRNPSKYDGSEPGLGNWAEWQKTLMDASALEVRLKMFNELLALGEKYKRVNQYQ